MKTLQNLFQEEYVEVPEGLSYRVFANLEIAVQARRTQQKYLWGVFSLLSLSALIGSSVYAFQAFATSSFSTYFSLIFSDAGSIAILWKDLALSLVESLPLFGIIIILSSVSALLWSIRKFSKNSFVINAHAHATLA